MSWGLHFHKIGERQDVLDGFPFAFYLSPRDQARYAAISVCEIADCHVPAEGRFPSRLVAPRDVSTSLRGGGNVSRQIVDVIPPIFPAERLIAVEVYTPEW